jgi:hypothetical protein
MRFERPSILQCVTIVGCLAACGAKTPLRVGDSGAEDDRPSMRDVVTDPLAREVCNNGVDDNGDGAIDEGCPVCIRAGASPWQVHRGGPPLCFGRLFFFNGDREMYAFEGIPAEDAPGWSAVPALSIDFAERSTLCDRPCTCLDGGDFTHFQTVFSIPDGFRVQSFAVSIRSVDDGAKVTIFNAANPMGVVDPGAFAFIPGGTTARLERYLTVGTNRVVVTHLDSCCSERALLGVRVLLNGGQLEQCR